MQGQAGSDDVQHAGEKYLALEHEVALILVETVTVSEAYPKVLETIATSLGWQFGAVWEEEPAPKAFVRCVETWCADPERLKEFARYILAHVHAVVLGDRRVLTNSPFVTSLKLGDTVFDVEQMRAAYAPFAESTEIYPWTLNAFALEPFLPSERMQETACV